MSQPRKIVLNNSKFYTDNQRVIFMDCKARFIFLKAGRRYGKTMGGRRWFLTQASDKRAVHLPCYWVSPTIEMARKVFDSFVKEYRKILKSVNISRRQIILWNDRELFFVGCDKPESIEGAGLWALVFDEVRHVKKETVWTETLRPMLGDGKKAGGGRACIISTPISPNHWFSVLGKKIKDGKETYSEYQYFKRTTLDGGNIDEEEIETARRELPPAIFERNYLALDTVLEGLIYPEYSEKNNIIPKMPDWFHPWEVNCGLDFGASEDHPTVFTVVGKDRSGKFNVVMAEYYIDRPNITDILLTAKRLQTEYKITYFYTDHNRPEFVRRMNCEGLRAQLAIKAVAWGIEIVRELLYVQTINQKARLLFVDSKTKKLQEEIQSYQYREGTEIPLKMNDDGMDSMRYVLVMTNGPRSVIKEY